MVNTPDPQAWLFIPLKRELPTQIQPTDLWRRLHDIGSIETWFYAFAPGIVSPLLLSGEDGQLQTLPVMPFRIEEDDEPELHAQLRTLLLNAQSESGTRIVMCPAPAIQPSPSPDSTPATTPEPLIEGELF